METVDKTGIIRSPEEFVAARKIIEKRLVGKIPQAPEEIELFMQLTTIRDALQLAETISARIRAKTDSK